MLSQLPTKCSWVRSSVLINFSLNLRSDDPRASRILRGIHVSGFLILGQEFADAAMRDLELPADITLTKSKTGKIDNTRPQFQGQWFSADVHASELVTSAITYVKYIRLILYMLYIRFRKITDIKTSCAAYSLDDRFSKIKKNNKMIGILETIILREARLMILSAKELGGVTFHVEFMVTFFVVMV